MRKVNIHILNAGGRLDKLPFDPKTQIESALKKVEKHLTIVDVDIVFGSRKRVIPETGWSGNANNNLVQMFVNPGNENALRNPQKDLLGTLAHELHHVMRFAAGHQNNTLLEMLVGEGLTTNFEENITNGEIDRPWAHALDQDQKQKYWSQAKNELHDEDYDYHEWFLNFSGEGIPKWTGYTLGYDLVKAHTQKTGKSAAELVDEPAENFLDTLDCLEAKMS